MKKQGYYSSGEFARMAGVTLRTIRYYDKINILKPSLVTDSGARFYTEKDLAKLQQILLFKYLGFSLEDIQEMTVEDIDSHFLENALRIQHKLMEDRIEQMQLVSQAISDTAEALKNGETIDWSQMLHLIHLTNMEQSMKHQYQDASNISARINLHSLYSTNPQGWFVWIYEQLLSILSKQQSKHSTTILEVGCGDGTLWRSSELSEHIHITLTDISEGMLRDARRNIGIDDDRFSFEIADCQSLPYEDESFDVIIANHVLFYPEDIDQAIRELRRVLKPGGTLLTSTYGRKHMQEISTLVQKFDERITLSANKLYTRFGKENGAALLSPYFEGIHWNAYEDSLLVPDPDALISYILSCHGNQNQYILDRYADFKTYVKKKCSKHHPFTITKDAGVFLCRKSTTVQ